MQGTRGAETRRNRADVPHDGFTHHQSRVHFPEPDGPCPIYNDYDSPKQPRSLHVSPSLLSASTAKRRYPLTAPTIEAHYAPEAPPAPASAIPAISISRAPSVPGLEHPPPSQALEREPTRQATTAPCGRSDMENIISDDSPLAQLLQGATPGTLPLPC
mgnify:CR=1 FL=1